MKVITIFIWICCIIFLGGHAMNIPTGESLDGILDDGKYKQEDTKTSFHVSINDRDIKESEQG